MVRVFYQLDVVDKKSSKEVYGDWSAEYQGRITSIEAPDENGDYLNDDWYSYEDFAIEAKPGDNLYVITQLYSDGDSFGCSTGNIQVMGVFKEKVHCNTALRELQKQVVELDKSEFRIMLDDQTAHKHYNAAYGYFSGHEHFETDFITVC